MIMFSGAKGDLKSGLGGLRVIRSGSRVIFIDSFLKFFF